MMYKGLLPETQLLYVIEKNGSVIENGVTWLSFFSQLTELKVYFLLY